MTATALPIVAKRRRCSQSTLHTEAWPSRSSRARASALRSGIVCTITAAASEVAAPSTNTAARSPPVHDAGRDERTDEEPDPVHAAERGQGTGHGTTAGAASMMNP